MPENPIAKLTGAALERAIREAAALEQAARMARAAEQGFDTSKVWYHGANRLDRLVEGKALNPKRATSGPMPFFTDDPEIAARYASGKSDTSLEAPATYAGWFKFKVPGSRHQVDVDRYWHHLSREQQAELTERLSRVGQAEHGGAIVLGPDAEVGPGGASHWKWTLERHRGNALAAARDIWLDSGVLFNNEERFLEVLGKAGLPGAIYDNPQRAQEGVLAVHARVRNPLDVRDPAAIAKVLPELRAALPRRRSPRRQWGVDSWDKRTKDPREWLAALEQDGENGFAWTSIPDWVTERLRALGYDGVRDTGGKMGGPTHQVLVPFAPNQVRVPWAKFDPRKVGSSDLVAGLAGAAAVGAASSDADAAPVSDAAALARAVFELSKGDAAVFERVVGASADSLRGRFTSHQLVGILERSKTSKYRDQAIAVGRELEARGPAVPHTPAAAPAAPVPPSTLGSLFDEPPAPVPSHASTLKDVALPGLETVRDVDQALPQFEAPFALTSEVAKGPKKPPTSGSLFGAGTVAAGTSDSQLPTDEHEARIRGLAAMRPMPSHKSENRHPPPISALPTSVDRGFRGAERIGPAPAPAAPRPSITPPGLFDKGTSRLSDFLATPHETATPQRFPLDEFIDLSQIGDPASHGPASLAAITAFHGSPHKFDKFALEAIGSGEGAQVYGHGLYFTEKEQIAKQYRDKLAGPARDKALAIDNSPLWHGNRTYEPTDHDVMGHIPDAMHEARMEMAVSELPPEARDLVNGMIEQIKVGERGGWPAHWEPLWKRVQELAPDFDLNTVTDLAPARKYNKLRRGMLELHARASYSPHGKDGLARIRQTLVDTLTNYDHMKTQEGVGGWRIPDHTHYHAKDAEAALYALDHYGERLDILPPETPGALYEVAIDAEPDELLHWDKPLAEQPAAVQKALGVDQTVIDEWHRIKTRIPELEAEKARIVDDDASWDGEGGALSLASHRKLAELNRELDDLRGRGALATQLQRRTGRDAWQDAVQATGAQSRRARPPGAVDTYELESPAAAAKALRGKGIKGIKYLDGFSRAAGEGTHNYVVFDDSLIDIKRQYAALLAAGGAGAAAAASQRPQDRIQAELEARIRAAASGRPRP